MVQAKTVDKKISASKRVIKKELKKERSKNAKHNAKQDAEITKLREELDKLKKKKAARGHVSEYNFFIRKQIKSGRTFVQAAKQWSSYKKLQEQDKRRPSAYNQFIGSQMRIGKTFTQSVALWKLAKAGKLGKKGSTRTVTKTVVRRITSKPKIIVRKSKPKIIVRRSKPKLITRTITRTRTAAPSGINSAQFKSMLESSAASHSLTKHDLKEALGPDDEEIAFKIMQTYFIEVARLGFKRRLTLDEIIDAYFYSLARVKMKGAKPDNFVESVNDSGIVK
jgi:hypothetical protein